MSHTPREPRRKAEVGDLSKKQQRLLRITEEEGSDKWRHTWYVECERSPRGEYCGHRYGLWGSDFHLRSCPRCMKGRPGQPFKEG
jgi:hypothetical protein